jgi:hypothetical protein
MTTDYTALSLADVAAEFAAIARDAQSVFRVLDEHQLNWRPDANSWSVAQCFDHLLNANREMFQAIIAATNGSTPPTVWQRLPVHGRALLRAELVRPDGTTAVLSLSEVEPGVFEVETSAKPPGVYRFRVLAQGVTLRKRPFTREQLITAAVWRGGGDSPPSSKDDPGVRNERLCHLLDCLLKREVLGGFLERQHIDLDALTRCLRRLCDDRLR